jgi:hypothetical protein
MSEDAEPKGNRDYADAEFLELVPEEEVKYVATHRVAHRLGCAYRTANRRLIELAKGGEHGVDIYDCEAKELVEPESV